MAQHSIAKGAVIAIDIMKDFDITFRICKKLIMDQEKINTLQCPDLV